jgi:hypothetical protein
MKPSLGGFYEACLPRGGASCVLLRVCVCVCVVLEDKRHFAESMPRPIAGAPFISRTCEPCVQISFLWSRTRERGRGRKREAEGDVEIVCVCVRERGSERGRS